MIIRLPFLVKFILAIALPFVFVNGSFALLAQIVPGVVSVSSWEMASSFIFVANIALVVWVLEHSKINIFLSFILGVFALLLMLYSAFFMQVHSNCGEPRAKFVGEVKASESVQSIACK